MGDQGLARAAGIGLAVLFVLQVGAVWSVDFLLTNDGPQHLLMAYVNRFYHSSPLRFDETWFLSDTLTAHGYREVFDVLSRVLPWRQADRLASHLPILIGSVGWVAVARWHGGAWQLRGLALVGLSITWHYWLGLLPFAWATGLTPWIVLLWWSTGLRSPVSVVSFGALLVVQAMCHPFPAALVGVVTLAFALAGGDRVLAIRTTLAGVPSAIWVSLVTQATDLDDVGPLVGKRIEVLETFRSFLPGPDFVVVGLMTFLGASLLWSGRRGQPRRSRVAALVCGTGLVLTTLMPRTIGGWDLVGPRVLTLLVPLLVALSPDLPRLASRVFGAVCFVAGAGYLVAVGWFHREVKTTWGPTLELAFRTMPTLAGLDWEFQIVAAPLHTNPGIPQFGPSLHIPQVLAVERGGRPVYTQAEDATIHAILRPPRVQDHLGHVDVNVLGSWERLWPGQDDLERRAIELAGHFAYMTRHDLLFVVGRRSDVEGLRRAGYTDIRTLGEVDDTLVLFQATPGPGCSATIAVNTLGADVLEIGVVPRVTPVDAIALGAGANVVRLEGLPCGRWWLRTENPLGGEGPHVAVDVSSDVVLDVALEQKGMWTFLPR